MKEPVETVPAVLREAIAADLSSVRPLPSPTQRSITLLPVAALVLVAAPVTFSTRDVAALGWFWSWGASWLQAVLGFSMTIAALREAVPGRSWSRAPLTAWVLAPIASVIVLALVSWDRSPVALVRDEWFIGAVCVVYGLASALPAMLLTVVLAVRAWPTRPVITGWLAGLGGGLIADAGWRLFCHFSDPSHVLAAHLSGVIAAGALGALITGRLSRGR